MDGRGSELQQVAGMQRFWWRAQDAQTPEPSATRRSQARPARPVTVLQIPRGERRFRKSRRASRRLKKIALIVGALFLVAGGAALFLPLHRLRSVDLGRTFDVEANALMIAAGFGINQVNVSGQHYAVDNDIYDALDLTNVKTFAAFDSEAALKRIERIPWIDKAQITRVYPGTLDIVVRERTPAVIWTRGNENYLVDATGRVLGPVPATNGWALPRVVGEGAQSDATLMLAALRQYPAIESQYAYAERVAERRWRIVLKNGTALELGADREIEGLEEIARAHSVTPAFKGAPMIVDVRTPGRIAIRPAGGKLARTAALDKSPSATSVISSR
jgi:cell division protein FtsQ